jgi:predicted dehydrogenase
VGRIIHRVRFGLFGTGHWADITHGAALAAHPAVDLVGVWGRDPAKAAVLAGRHGTRPYDDVDALLADVEAVAIALPPDVQAGIAVRAADAGRHLLLDKPLAGTDAAADAVVAAVERTGVSSIVFFTNRFVPAVSAFLADAAGQAYTSAQICMCASIFQPGNPYGASPWRQEKGGLWDLGPHALSLALPVLGPARTVKALGGPHDTSYLLIGHDSGAVSQLELTVNAPPGRTRFASRFEGPDGLVVVPPWDVDSVQAFSTAIDELLARPARHPCDVRFGRDVVRVLTQAQRQLA